MYSFSYLSRQFKFRFAYIGNLNLYTHKINLRTEIAGRFMPGSTASLDCKSKTKYIYRIVCSIKFMLKNKTNYHFINYAILFTDNLKLSQLIFTNQYISCTSLDLVPTALVKIS